MTKNFTLFLTLFALLLLTACDKADKYTQFYLDYNTPVGITAIYLPNMPLIEVYEFSSEPTATNTTEHFSSYNTRSELIEKINLEEITLTFSQPEYANFDCIDNIQIFIAAEDLPEIKIAEQNVIPIGQTILPLNVTETNLIQYVKSENYTLRTVIGFRTNTRQERQLNIASRFFVDAKILGL
jgi:hypothetical protein